MIIAFYVFLMKVVVPFLAMIFQTSIVLIITLAGIILLFAAMGMRISNGLGTVVVHGIFRAIGYLVRTIISAIGWIVRSVFRLMPRVFFESRRIFSQMGIKNGIISNLLAVLVVLVLLIIII